MTRRTQHQPTEFAAADDYRAVAMAAKEKVPVTPIQRMAAIRWVAQAALDAYASPDEDLHSTDIETEGLCAVVNGMDDACHNMSASCWEDVIEKLKIWRWMMENPRMFQEDVHAPHIALLLDDVRRLADLPE
ncbi:hypothetical protein MWN34_12645 [Ancylobacter sp. 6x-1]|uniref:Uncharacterized protein n=1 Tax=Ancylobacter crimeensis TaxID=2579147 RepID=A0ABT0DCR3_9HYPH|nr:hypothetical protein [Ancylobacter crimeensis]MCK0197760.1 hypothetical protein [Ancylobacter crimeensis]